MKKILFILLVTANIAFGQNTIYHGPNIDLRSGEQYAMFGDDVKFRASPDVKSEVLELLKIGTKVEVVEKTVETFLYNGIESHFYKVKNNGKTGYILGGLISLEQKESADTRYLFAYKMEDANYSLLVRVLSKNNSYRELTAALGNPGIDIHLLDSKGVEGVESMLYVNNRAEACGVYGGEIYFFQTKDGLKKAFTTEIYSDAGVFWVSEKLIFPNDDDGVAGKIVYEIEQGEYGDEATNEVHVSKTSRELRWENGEILPKIEASER